MQRSDVQQDYLDVRQMTHALCQPLAIEDYVDSAGGLCEPTEMAPGAYHLVLRDVCAATVYARLYALSSTL